MVKMAKEVVQIKLNCLGLYVRASLLPYICLWLCRGCWPILGHFRRDFEYVIY